MTTSYNPFHHLVSLKHNYFEGDAMVRLAFLELIKQNGLTFTGPYANALETTSFPARLQLAVYDELYPDGVELDTFDQKVPSDITSSIIGRITNHITSDPEQPHDGWVPDLSLADQDAVIKAVSTVWTAGEKRSFLKPPRSAEVYETMRRPASALSAHFSVTPFSTAVIHQVEGGKNSIPERHKFISRLSGPWHMTWKACDEWGYKLVKTPGFPDSAEVYVNIEFVKPPKDVTLVATSSRDDVPDPDKPGEMKSEQLIIKMSKGKNNRSRSLNARDLKYHDWVFTVEDARTP